MFFTPIDFRQLPETRLAMAARLSIPLSALPLTHGAGPGNGGRYGDHREAGVVMVARTNWEDLPEATKRTVEQHTGRVWSARTVSTGMNSAVAAVLTTERGTVFVKGLQRDYRRRWTQDMEAMINPHVAHLSPRLLWRVQDEWDLLGFESVDGRHADYGPGSADLPQIAHTVATLGEIACPDLPVKVATHRWREYVDAPEELQWLAGDRLLHTDYNPLNVLIASGRALLIDWAWATRGAGWIDCACLIVRLVADGHRAVSAEAVVQEVPAWRTAPAEGLTVFSRISLRMWQEVADGDASDWTQRMARAATEWAAHRTRI